MAMTDTENVNAALVDGIDDNMRAEWKDPDGSVQTFSQRSGLRKLRQTLDGQSQGRGIGVSLPHAEPFDSLPVDGPDVGARRFGKPEARHSGGAGAGDGLGARFGEDFIQSPVAHA